MCQVTLSRLVPVEALVGHYPTNKLIGDRPLPDRRTFDPQHMSIGGVIRYYRHFRKGTEVPPLFLCPGYVIHVFLTRSPLTPLPKERRPFDLHALATPPAFVLSQDQTLQLIDYSKS